MGCSMDDPALRSGRATTAERSDYALISSPFREDATPPGAGSQCTRMRRARVRWLLLFKILRSVSPAGSSRLLKCNRDRVALGERLDASAPAGVGSLGQNLPAVPKHLGNVSVHPLDTEEPLAMVGSVPASLVCVGFHLHGSVRLCLRRNPSSTGVISLRTKGDSCTNAPTKKLARPTQGSVLSTSTVHASSPIEWLPSQKGLRAARSSDRSFGWRETG
jgi:hypothetical protein